MNLSVLPILTLMFCIHVLTAQEKQNLHFKKVTFKNAQYIPTANLKQNENINSKGLLSFWENHFDNPSHWNIWNQGVPSTDWVIGTTPPIGEYSSDYYNVVASSFEGNFAMFDSDALGTSYSDVQEAYLTLGSSVDCSEKYNVHVSFKSFYWRYNDHVYFEYSNDSINWNQVELHLDLSINQSTGFQEPPTIIIDVSDLADDNNTLYFQFHFSGSWDYVWCVDDIEVAELLGKDGEVTAIGPVPGWEYNVLPFSQTLSNYDLTANLKNTGIEDLDSVLLEININNIGYTNTASLESTLIQDETIVMSTVFDGTSVNTPGILEIDYTILIDNDDVSQNNYDHYSWFMNHSTLGSIIHTSNTPYIVSDFWDNTNTANYFELVNQDTLTSISALMHCTPSSVGSQITFYVQEIINDSVLGNVLISSNPYTITNNNTTVLTEIFTPCEPTILPPGKYLVGHSDNQAGVFHVAYNQRFTGLSLFSQGNNELEDFSSSGTFALWLNFGDIDIPLHQTKNQSFNDIIDVFPNPTSHVVNLQATAPLKSNINIELYDLTGKRIFQNQWTKSSLTKQIDVSNLPTGFYNLKLESNKGTYYHKIEVTH